jgi:Zn-dependent protease with chaperone function
MNAIASNNASLICPKGHGMPSMRGSIFCDKCGLRLLSAVVAQPAPMPQIPNAYHQPRQVTPMPQFTPAQFNGPLQPFGGPANQPKFCSTCGGNGARLIEKIIVCSECRWLRPLAPNYKLDCEAFQWAQDGAAMSRLRSIAPLQSVAKTISDKVGRRWIETTLNAIRLGENQMPEVYHQAIRAARILGMQVMPEIYVSGDRMWDAMTFGSDDNAFIVLGTAIITNFRGDDLLFILAREMGHCRAGHALWKTVGTFLVGEQGPRRGLMAGGIFSMISKAMNPTQWVESALEIPLLAWARQAEITADRAGLLAVGDQEIVRRVLLSWSLKSSTLYRQINVEAWLQQQEDTDDEMIKLSEMLSSSTPYITRRLKLMGQFANEPQMNYWRGMILNVLPKALVKPVQKPIQNVQPQRPQQIPQQLAATNQATKPNAIESLKLNCAHCKTAMRVPGHIFIGKDSLNVKCPNPQCGKVNSLRKKVAPKQQPSAKELKRENEMSDE